MAKGGTVVKKNGKYLWVGYFVDENGKTKRPTKTFDTKREAEAYQKLQLEESKHIKNLKTNTDYTVREFYLLWQKETQWDTEKFYKITTTNNWRYTFDRHILPYIGNEKLQNIDYTRLQEHLNNEKLSQKTCKNILKDIKSMLKYAYSISDDLIIIDKLDKVKIKIEKDDRAKIFNLLAESDYQTILAYMKTKDLYYTNLIEFLHETGVRIEEALAIKPEDINTHRKTVAIYKAIKRKNITNKIRDKSTVNTALVLSYYLKSSSAGRVIPLLEYAERAVEAQQAMLREKGIVSEFLFPTRTGKPADARNVLRSFHDSIKACNRIRDTQSKIPIRGLHSLRKLFCKRMRDETEIDWERLAKLMGHSNSDVTKKYYYSMTDEDIFEIAKLINANDKRLIAEKEREEFLRSIEGADGDWDQPDVVYVEEEF